MLVENISSMERKILTQPMGRAIFLKYCDGKTDGSIEASPPWTCLLTNT